MPMRWVITTLVRRDQVDFTNYARKTLEMHADGFFGSVLI